MDLYPLKSTHYPKIYFDVDTVREIMMGVGNRVASVIMLMASSAVIGLAKAVVSLF